MHANSAFAWPGSTTNPSALSIAARDVHVAQLVFFLNRDRCICIHLHVSNPSIPILPCMCASFRRASRALSQLYDDALRPLGLRSTQFSILQTLALTGEISQGNLGQVLAMDSTTLTRTLEIMRHSGWVAKQLGHDRRERRLSLTTAGRVELKRALPHWEKVQAQIRQQLGAGRWRKALDLTNEVTSRVTAPGDSR